MLQSSSPKRLPISLLRRAARQATGSAPPERAHAIASVVFDWYLGPEWLQQANMAISPSRFSRKATVREPPLLRINRLVSLAEMLFNLRDVDGIGEVIAQLQAQQVESAFARLEVGKILSGHGIKFNFIGPHEGNKSYDIELILPEGMAAYSETKSIIDLHEFRPKSVEDELKRACSQLPADVPGIIFVRVPNEWLRSSDGANPHGNPSTIRFQLGDVARSFIRQNRRIVVVEFYSDRLWFGGASATEATDGLEITSISHQFDRTKSWELLTTSAHALGETVPNWWVSLSALGGAKPDNAPKLDRLIPKDQLHVYTMEPPLPNWPSNDP